MPSPSTIGHKLDWVSAAPAPLYALNEEHCVVAVSGGWLSMMGTTREAAVGRAEDDYVRPGAATSPRHTNALWEVRGPHPGPVRRTALATVDTARGPVTVMWLQDATVDDQARLAREEAARSKRERDELAYVVSHDLQGPLRTVVSFAALLRERHLAELGPEAQEFMSFLLDGVALLQRRLDALLRYSRAGRGAPEAVDLEALLTDLVQVRHAAGRVGWGPLPDVVGIGLPTLVAALVDNALAFHAPGAAPDVHVEAGEDEAGAWLTVRDRGIGIDPAQHERIFGVFQRLHLDDEYPGVGIGLAVARRVAEANRGTLTVSSRPGQGSTFRFSWPRPGASASDRASFLRPPEDLLTP